MFTLGNPLAIFPDRWKRLQAFQGGARAIALVAVGGNLFVTGRLAFLVEQQLAGCQRYDFIGKQTGLLGSCGALLALQRVGILLGATDAVTCSNNLGGFDHRNVGSRHDLQHCFGARAVSVLVLGLGQRQRFNPAADGNFQLAGHDRLGRFTYRHQAGRAHAIKRHTGHGIAKAAGVGAQPANVVALGALLYGGAHDHITYLLRPDTRALNHRTDHVAAENRGLGVIEGASEGLGQRGTRDGNNNGIMHAMRLLRQRD